MKLIYSLIIMAFVFIYIAEPKMTFKPFSLKFENWLNSVGWLLMWIGIIIVTTAARKKGRETMLKEVMEIVEKEKKEKE